MATDLPRENSVKQLSDFYNVVTGVALVEAITVIVDKSDVATIPVRIDLMLNFLAFLAIIVPFHQGAVRHLFATYVEGGGSSRIQRGALALDFFILFAEACLFVALALLIPKTQRFTEALIALLLLDCAWGFLATLAFTGAQAQTAERKWSLINIVAVAVLILMHIFGSRLLGGWNYEMKIAVFSVCVIRTIVDYYSSWDFYYPSTDLTKAAHRPKRPRQNTGHQENQAL